MALVGTKDIAGTEVEVHATLYGAWRIFLDDEVIGTGDNVEAALSQARRKLARNKVKVKVPFRMPDGRRGVAHGIHAKTRDVLTRVEGESEQLSSYARVLRDDIPDFEMERYRMLVAKANDAQREANKIADEYKLDLGKTVREEIERAAAQASLEEAQAVNEAAES